MTVQANDTARTNAPARVLISAALICALSVLLGYWLLSSGLASSTSSANGYFVTLNLYAVQDIWVGPAMALIILAAWKWGTRLVLPVNPPSVGVVPMIAFGAVALSVVFRFLAHHNYQLAIDEFMPTFQAAIFRSGQLMAPLGDQELELVGSLQPFFTYVDEGRQVWIQHYRPIHAAILSLFPPEYAQAIAHSILTGITVLAIADIAKRLWPDRAGAPVLAAALLVASPQVLLTSASGFAFTTHLAFNTVWLALFLRGSWGAHVAAAAVGFFALGIHQVHVHAIYVFPFGVAMLLGYFGNRLKTLPYIFAYGIGVPVWILWPEIATWLHTGDISALPHRLLDVEYISNYIAFSGSIGVADRQFSALFLTLNISRFLLWMSPSVVLLLVSSVVARRRLGALPTICAIGFLFTVLMSHLLLPNQMHTIGSRYYHPALANVIVVCVATFYAFGDDAVLRRTTVAALLAGGVIFLPWRAWQIHQKVGPRAAIQARLDVMEVDSIVIRAEGAWFMPDFIRNDPFLKKGPVYYGDNGSLVSLLSDGPMIVLTGEDLVEMGLPRGTLLEPEFPFTSR